MFMKASIKTCSALARCILGFRGIESNRFQYHLYHWLICSLYKFCIKFQYSLL